MKAISYSKSDTARLQGNKDRIKPYGNFEGMRNGRYFSDFTEESFQELLQTQKVVMYKTMGNSRHKTR